VCEHLLCNVEIREHAVTERSQRADPPGVRPIMRFASAPTARILPPSSIAITEGRASRFLVPARRRPCLPCQGQSPDPQDGAAASSQSATAESVGAALPVPPWKAVTFLVAGLRHEGHPRTSGGI
jgi:hypothetical protein